MGSLFSKPKPPSPPKPPPVMPVPDDDLVKQAELRKIQLAQSTGRASTILTDSGSGDKLG